LRNFKLPTSELKVQSSKLKRVLGFGVWILRFRAAGSSWAGGVMLALILILLGAILTDVYHLSEVRNFAYGLAADAAMAGANLGRDFEGYYHMGTRGELWLGHHDARTVALNVVEAGMAQRGITDYQVIIHVITNPNGGQIPGFPPVPRADLTGEAGWETDGPAVGVYLAVQVETNLFGLVNGGQPITVHAFHAAEVSEVQP